MSDTPATASADSDALEAMMSMNPNSLLHRMQIEVLEATPERLVARMPVEGNTQPYGLLHGGASVVLAETLGSIGSALHAGPHRIAVGLDINATHHRAARSGFVTGTATALSLGNTLASYDVVITDDQDKRVCTCRTPSRLRPAPRGA
jgi:uncharacterized protein (TIGR00369 family)